MSLKWKDALVMQYVSVLEPNDAVLGVQGCFTFQAICLIPNKPGDLGVFPNRVGKHKRCSRFFPPILFLQDIQHVSMSDMFAIWYVDLFEHVNPSVMLCTSTCMSVRDVVHVNHVSTRPHLILVHISKWDIVICLYVLDLGARTFHVTTRPYTHEKFWGTGNLISMKNKTSTSVQTTSQRVDEVFLEILPS